MSFRGLLDRFYRRKTDGYKVIILGLDGAGKTTMLYKLVLGKIVATIPTIGLNVETVKAPTTSGRDLTVTMWDIGIGCGGARHLVPVAMNYAVYADAIIWMVDSTPSSSDILDESVEMLGKLLRSLALKAKESKKMSFPILLLANKQDRPGAMTPLQIHNKFAAICEGRVFSVFPTSITEEISMGGLPEAFTWLLHVIENPAPTTTHDITVHTSSNATPPDETPTSHTPSDKLSVWISRTESDSSPEELITQFENISLPAWDHYTHIRIAYTILTTHGRQKGKNMIFDGIERYIAKSAQTRGRTFHITMTYFWIQMVHFGIRSMPPMYAIVPTTSNPTGSSATLVESEVAQKTDAVSPSLADFSAFLMLNPYVMDGNLWAEYFSKDVMMSPEAKAGVVLPDKKSLPNLVSRDAIVMQKVV